LGRPLSAGKRREIWNLRLRKLAELLDEEMAKAEKTDCSYQAPPSPRCSVGAGYGDDPAGLRSRLRTSAIRSSASRAASRTGQLGRQRSGPLPVVVQIVEPSSLKASDESAVSVGTDDEDAIRPSVFATSARTSESLSLDSAETERTIAASSALENLVSHLAFSARIARSSRELP